MHLFSFPVLLTLLAQLFVPAAGAQQQPYQRTLVITAYYSPEPGQCCYVKGDLEADKILNGNGTHGADGTPVYSGMVAAPSNYAFGTRIVLPGLGTVTVHDRGGAILAGPDTDRLDIWAGRGQEGLARAVAFGVQTVTATVYPPGTQQPPESMDITSLPAPMSALRPYIVTSSVIASLITPPRYGESGNHVSVLQESLKTAGYFAREVTGFYGDVTKASIVTFLRDVGLPGDGNVVTATGSIYLSAAAKVQSREESLPFISPESSPRDLATARRLLRALGYYRGRSVGPYDDKLAAAITAFQKDRGLVADAHSPGAGRVGPLTRSQLATVLRSKRIARAAERMLRRERVRAMLVAKKMLPSSFAELGEKGEVVAAIQRSLSLAGLFPASKVNGTFGPLTQEAIVQYQLRRNIVASEQETGAGRVGPSTLQSLQNDAIMSAERRVSAYGWAAL